MRTPILKWGSKIREYLDRISLFCGILGIVLPITGFIMQVVRVQFFSHGPFFIIEGLLYLIGIGMMLFAPWIFGILAIATSIATRSENAPISFSLGVFALLIGLFFLLGFMEALHRSVN